MIDTIVVGGGFAGLASTIYSLKRGNNTLLIDSHYSLGGCAGFYQRKKYTFDVGATTLSAMDSNSVLRGFLDELGIFPEVVQVDPGIVIHRNGSLLKRFSKKVEWVHELEKNGFSSSLHFWSKMEDIESMAFDFLMRNNNLPPKGPLEFLKLVKDLKIKDYTLIKASITPFRRYLKAYKIETELKRIIDEQLLISIQTTSDHTNLLAASMGLSYPSQTYSPIGGMKAFVEVFIKKIKELKGEILTRNKVISIQKSKDTFTVITQDHKGKTCSYKTKRVISNLPIWNMKDITKEKFFQRQSKKFNTSWGAFTCYIGFKPKEKIKDSYHQIHVDDSPLGNKSFFFSFSLPQDELRAPQGHQVVTISSHTDCKKYFSQNEQEYKEFKKQVQDYILNLFFKTFQSYEIEEIGVIESGTPRTFARFTGRYEGRVGGHPHFFLKPAVLFPGHHTPIKELYCVGDTTFPGQGIVGVLCGASLLFKGLENDLRTRV